MRTWRRAFTSESCGLCRKAMAPGDPVLVLTIASIKRPIVRCPGCAGYPPPDDLPPLPVRTPIPTTSFVPIPTGPDALPFDYKQVAAGDREPGSDDD